MAGTRWRSRWISKRWIAISSSSSRRRWRKGLRAGRSSGRNATRSGLSESLTPSANQAFPSARRNTRIQPAWITPRLRFPTRVWHETHTFTVFPFPTFTEEDMHQIAHALVKVIDAYSRARQEIRQGYWLLRTIRMRNKIRWGVVGSGGIARRRTIPEGIVPAVERSASGCVRQQSESQCGGGPELSG